MDNAEELPGYVLNDPQSFLRFLEDCYRKRSDVVIHADDCRYLAEALRENLRSRDDGGGDLFL